MLEKQRLRKADVLSSLVLMFFGLWVLKEASTYPMKDSWGGVQNVWYVSPAIFPLFIGGAMLLVSLILLIQAIKADGLRDIIKTVFPTTAEYRAGVLRLVFILLVLGVFVYLHIPRIDFFLSVMLFLGVFITPFYLYRPDLLKKLTIFYLITNLVLLLLFALGVDRTLRGYARITNDTLQQLPGDHVPEEVVEELQPLTKKEFQNQEQLLNAIVNRLGSEDTATYRDQILKHATIRPGFLYSMDVLVFLINVGYLVYSWLLIGPDREQQRKLRTAIIVSIVVPLIICPVFRYSLLVPLPHEGGVIAMFHYVRFTLLR